MEIIKDNIKYKEIFNFIKSNFDNNQIKNNIYSSIVLKIKNKYVFTGITTGNKNIKPSNNFQISDMHSEILSIKLFKYFINNNLLNKEYFDVIDSKYTLKKLIKVILFISKIPCGDCSLIKYDNKILEIGKSIPINNTKNIEEKYIKKLKPFRKDLPDNKISNSLSCTDKLLRYSLTGIQVNSNMKPIKIDNIVLEYDLGKYNSEYKQIIINNINESLNIKNRWNNNKKLKILKNNKIQLKYKLPKIIVLFNKNNYKNISSNESILIYNNKKRETINGKTGLLVGASIKNSNIKTSSLIKNLKISHDKNYYINKLIYKYLIN